VVAHEEVFLKHGPMQHKDKIIFELNGKDAAVAMPQSLQKILKIFTNNASKKKQKSMKNCESMSCG